MDFLSKNNEGLLLTLKVMPNSSKNELIKQDSGLKLRITAPPVDNKANKFVVNYLSKLFKVPKTSIKILYGELSREKTILFMDITDEKCNFIKEQLSLL